MADDTRNTVVVADDDADVRSLLGEYLTGCGFTVLEAENGLEDPAARQERPSRAVVLDVPHAAPGRRGRAPAHPRVRSVDRHRRGDGDEDPARTSASSSSARRRAHEAGSASGAGRCVTLAAGGRAAAPVVAAAAAVVAAPAPGRPPHAARARSS